MILRNVARDMFDEQAKEKATRGFEPGNGDDEDVEDFYNTISNPSDWSALEELFGRGELSAIAKEIERKMSRNPDLAADMPLYLQLRVDGYSDRDVIDGQMLPSLKEKPLSQANWSKTYLPVVKEVLEKRYEVRTASEGTHSLVASLVTKTSPLCGGFVAEFTTRVSATEDRPLEEATRWLNHLAILVQKAQKELAGKKDPGRDVNTLVGYMKNAPNQDWFTKWHL
jgi:hypothetical protein